MPDLHLKGYLLTLLAQNEAMWDYELAEDALAAYGLSGDYWIGTVRLTLTDLYSGGLVDLIDSTVDAEKSGGKEKILMRYRLNDFGRERMRQTGLLTAAQQPMGGTA